jgi:hypothetical protein
MLRDDFVEIDENKPAITALHLATRDDWRCIGDFAAQIRFELCIQCC